MPKHDQLPDGVFDAALELRFRQVEQRIRRMYNRPRAVFAESIVAKLVGGTMSIDPSAPADITLSRRGKRPLAIQVKCSGSYLPATKKEGTRAGWDVNPAPSLHHLGPVKRHTCDLYVLARHEGKRIDAGWTFAVVRPRRLERLRTDKDKIPMVRMKHLEELGVTMVPASGLRAAVRALAG